MFPSCRKQPIGVRCKSNKWLNVFYMMEPLAVNDVEIVI